MEAPINSSALAVYFESHLSGLASCLVALKEATYTSPQKERFIEALEAALDQSRRWKEAQFSPEAQSLSAIDVFPSLQYASRMSEEFHASLEETTEMIQKRNPGILENVTLNMEAPMLDTPLHDENQLNEYTVHLIKYTVLSSCRTGDIAVPADGGPHSHIFRSYAQAPSIIGSTPGASDVTETKDAAKVNSAVTVKGWCEDGILDYSGPDVEAFLKLFTKVSTRISNAKERLKKLRVGLPWQRKTKCVDEELHKIAERLVRVTLSPSTGGDD